MKDSIRIVLFFCFGLLLGYLNFVPNCLNNSDFSNWVLYVLLFLVGISVGSDKQALKVIFKANWKIVLVPVSILIGSLLFAALWSFLNKNISLKDSVLVASGFGYYSLSSVLITDYYNELLGTVALLSNVFRELITLLLAPLLTVWFGKLAPIAAGGATAMDTTLPIITKASGNTYGVVAIFSGLVLSLLVPVLITFILSL